MSATVTINRKDQEIDIIEKFTKALGKFGLTVEIVEAGEESMELIITNEEG